VTARKALVKHPVREVEVAQEELAWFTPPELLAHPSAEKIHR